MDCFHSTERCAIRGRVAKRKGLGRDDRYSWGSIPTPSSNSPQKRHPSRVLRSSRIGLEASEKERGRAGHCLLGKLGGCGISRPAFRLRQARDLSSGLVVASRSAEHQECPLDEDEI